MSSNRKTYYDVLGVKATSDAAEIRSAYRKLVLKHHPDHSSDLRSAQILSQAIEAYEVLSDPVRRHSYDGLLAARARDAAPANAQKESVGERGSEAWAAWAREKEQQRQTEKERGSLTQELIRLSSLFSKSRFADAEELAHKIADKSPKEPLPYAVLGDIARARGDVGGAINMYARAVQADPHNQLYQHRYEELVHTDRGGLSKQTIRTPAQRAAPCVGYGICLLSCAYIA